MTQPYNALLDVLGEESPIPVIRTKEMLDTLSSGEILKVMTSKPSAIDNIKTLASNNPYVLLATEKSQDHFIVYIQKQ